METIRILEEFIADSQHRLATDDPDYHSFDDDDDNNWNPGENPIQQLVAMFLLALIILAPKPQKTPLSWVFQDLILWKIGLLSEINKKNLQWIPRIIWKWSWWSNIAHSSGRLLSTCNNFWAIYYSQGTAPTSESNLLEITKSFHLILIFYSGPSWRHNG